MSEAENVNVLNSEGELEKSSREKLQDTLRGQFACAFAAEQKIQPYHDPGALVSGYVKNKDGHYEVHSNGLARRFSVLGCNRGLSIWITEGLELQTYTIEIKNLIGETRSSYNYELHELGILFNKHLYDASRSHAINHFKNIIEQLPRDKMAQQYRKLKEKVGNDERNPFDMDTTRLTLLEVALSDLLESLIEEAFIDRAEMGRRAYLHVALLEAKRGLISWPIYYTIRGFINFTFPHIIKKFLLQSIALDNKIKPSEPDYRIWLEQTAELSCFLIELADSMKNKSERKIHRLVILSGKKKT